MDEEESEGQAERDVRPPSAHVRLRTGSGAAPGAWFSSLTLGFRSLFIQPQYQTFPFPAPRSPL